MGGQTDLQLTREVRPGAHVLRVSPGEAGAGRQYEVTLSEGPRPAEAWVSGARAKLAVRSEQEAALAAALGKSAGSVGDAMTANEKCSDGMDNDLDFFIDCEDWDCSHNPLVTVCADEPLVCG